MLSVRASSLLTPHPELLGLKTHLLSSSSVLPVSTLSPSPPLLSPLPLSPPSHFSSFPSFSPSPPLSPPPTLPPVDPEQFTRREVARKPRDAGPSYLSVMLAEHSKLSSNPFFDYSKFNGEVRWGGFNKLTKQQLKVLNCGYCF